MKPFKAFACVGTHGHIYVCGSSPHQPMIGRYEIFISKIDALNNAWSKDHVVEVEIRPIQKKKGRGK